MSAKPIVLTTPLSVDDVRALRTGDQVRLNGVIYTARDAAHARFAQAIREGLPLPFDPEGQVIYFVGPTPAKPGQVIGSAGPTTASRMDPYSPLLIERGLRGMIGKGKRAPVVREAMSRWGCVYFGAVEGTAALLSQHIRSAETIAYEDLGAESVKRLLVEAFPLVTINDMLGGDLYEAGREAWRKAAPPGGHC